MTDRAAFLRAIRARPDDGALRLVFADWLEEHGDPLADFIRLQCELEPLRDLYDDERAKALQEREWEMLRQHRAAWLGPLEEVAAGWPADFVFRRGLVEAVRLPVPTFLAHAEELGHWCPGLWEATLFEVRGRGAELARCPELSVLTRVELGDWLTGEDAEALAASPHLRGLRTLEVWLGSRNDEAVCRAFARSPALGGLSELRLIQLYGGYDAADPGELNARADRLAAEADRSRGAPLARVHRPFERLFPLRESVGYSLYAGRLPGGRQALVHGGKQSYLVMFDAGGTLIEERHGDLGGVLVREPEHPWEDYHEGELLDYLQGAFGFGPALIHVKEFYTDQGLAVHLWPGHLEDLLRDPDDPPSWADREELAPSIHSWLEGGDFVIDWGNDYYAGPDGTIHSS
jgi:uncharacterized protein (TIGR02996 family)